MHVKFPEIHHINDVLPHIEGRNDFVVADKGPFTVINYVVEMNDTFPPIVSDGGYDLSAAIKRECRGLVFCNKTGEILRRPWHKFFNVNQKEETLVQNISFHRPHVFLEKLDGSLISPFRDHAGKIWWGTKMVAEPFHDAVSAFVATRLNYIRFFDECHRNEITPMFEYVAPTNRIVVEYKQEDLILTGLRENRSGVYVDHNTMQRVAGHHQIPCVRAFPFDDFTAVESYIDSLEDAEGLVVCFDDGSRCKLKGSWYVQIHKVKDQIVYDRNIVQLILDENLDDLMPFVMDDERSRLMHFQSDFWETVDEIDENVRTILNEIHLDSIDRKTFATQMAPRMNPATKAIVFYHFDDFMGVRDSVIAAIRKTLTNNGRFEDLRQQWFPEVRYNAM